MFCLNFRAGSLAVMKARFVISNLGVKILSIHLTLKRKLQLTPSVNKMFEDGLLPVLYKVPTIRTSIRAILSSAERTLTQPRCLHAYGRYVTVSLLKLCFPSDIDYLIVASL